MILDKPNNLSKGSHTKVNVKCDVCGIEKSIEYRFYLKNVNNGGFYACSRKCCQSKIDSTCYEKYDVKNPSQFELFKTKIILTNLNKHGVENPFQSSEIKERIKDVMIEKYGYENPSQIEIFKEKRKQTMIKNHGVENYMQHDDFFRKSKVTCLEKYGFEYSFLNDNVKEKIKNTMMILYGVDHPSKSIEIIEKTKKTRLERGSYLTDEQRTEYRNYWLKVNNVTKKQKSKLFENWDGTDFYDKEYIKDNFSLTSGDRNYPTIDHIISVSYGFKNNISPEEIGKLENLCITKRFINSSKSKNTTYEIS